MSVHDVFDGSDEEDDVVSIDDPAASTQTPSSANGSPNESTEGDGHENEGSESVNPFLEYQQSARNEKQNLERQKFYLLLLSGALAISLTVAVIANVQISSSNRIEPFYVAVDQESGEVLRSGTATELQSLSEPVVRSKIREVIRGMRVVYADQRSTTRLYENAWNYISPGSEAEAFLRNTLKTSATGEEQQPLYPPALVGSIQRTITEMEINPVQGTNSYNIRWIEREVIPTTNRLVERAFTGSISTVRVEQASKEALKRNPLGLYIQGFSWQEASKDIIRAGSNSNGDSEGSAQSSTNDN